MATHDDLDLIDPPFGYGLDEWLRFKAEMEQRPLTAEVQDFIDEAKREIKALERGRPRWIRPPPETEGN